MLYKLQAYIIFNIFKNILLPFKYIYYIMKLPISFPCIPAQPAVGLPIVWFSWIAADRGKSVWCGKNISIPFPNSTGVHNLAFIYELSSCLVRDWSALLDFQVQGAGASGIPYPV